MIDEGLNFTLSTMRPPASIIGPMKDIQLKIPVIAMDGAVLYDTQEKRFLETINLKNKDSLYIRNLFESNGIIYFANVVVDDNLLIYYNRSKKNRLDDMQMILVDDLRKSPYRNYINRPLPENENVVYFMLFYPEKKAKEIYEMLVENGLDKKLKILLYPSKDYSGYSYIKVFNKNAVKENMINVLKQRLNVENIVTFGTVPSRYDFVVSEGDTNEVVHKMKKMFEGKFK